MPVEGWDVPRGYYAEDRPQDDAIRKRKLFTRPGCLGCEHAICDECDRDNQQQTEKPGQQR